MTAHRFLVLVSILILGSLIVVLVAAIAHAAGWAYVWGWGPTPCAAIGGKASWIWDSVLYRPNWLCKYPA